MAILKLVLAAYNITGTTASIIGGIDFALKHFSKSTAEDLFKKCFVDAVKQSAPKLAHFTEAKDLKTVSVDKDTLGDIITSLKNDHIFTLASLEQHDRLIEIIKLFQKCINLPGHQLTPEDLEQKIRPILEDTIVGFYNRLPFKQEAFNQMVLEFIQNSIGEYTNQEESRALLKDFLDKIDKAQLEFQALLIERTQAIKDDTTEIKKTTQANLDISLKLSSQFTDFSNQYLNVSISDAVTTEHQSQIDNARDLLKKGRPISALDSLENLKQRIWTNASSITKFLILKNIAAAQLALNKEREAAMLLLKAFQYNSKDETALSNRALAHFLLGELEKAADFAEKTLEQNSTDTNAYVVLVRISTDEERLEEVIAKVPEYLRDTPQIAHAISEIARQHRDFEEAIKWGEIMVEHEQEDVPSCKPALATILLEQVLNDHLAVLTNQLDESQKEQLRRAIGLITEAWDCVANTELRTFRTDWIINRSTAYVHLGELEEAIKDLDASLKIEPSNPTLLGMRAMLAFEQGKNKNAIGFLEKIQSAPETPDAPILLADILLAEERFDEAIKTLNEFLATDPPSELRENANGLLINAYIGNERFEEALRISATMRELSPTNILTFVGSARVFKAIGKSDEALSQLKEAYDHAQDSEKFQEIMELANELYIYGQFEAAATLYKKLANTSLNSQLTQRLLDSYYFSGERKKTLDICQVLRQKYGPLEKISEMEYVIYDEIGDMNQARAVCEAYLNKFPDDTDMQISLASIHYRSNNIKELDCLLERSFYLKNLSLPACFNLAYLHQVRSKPEKALDIMYEARRTHYDNPDAHLKYIGLFFQVSQQIGELLHSNQVQPGTAVYLNSSGQTNWYIIEKRADADISRQELNVNHPLAQRLLGKTVNDELRLRQNPFGPEIGKIAAIKSKYVHVLQESFRIFSELFPDTPGLGSIKLDDSHETDDSSKFQPLLDFINQQHEVSLQIEETYKENPLPIGAFTNWTGRDVLDTWIFLMSKPDLGVRCSVGNPEEKSQALALLGDPQPKLVVDLISLMTIHSIGAADAVIKAFGKLGIAQSTIDALQQITNEREGMWSKRKSMSVGKEGDQYVRTIITPEEVRQNVEYLKNVIKWIQESCEVHPCTPALQMNQLRKQELDNTFQPFFIDTLLIASQPGYLLLSDDERLRSYAKINLNHDAGTNFHIDGVWTQVVLEHCVNRNLLDKSEYDKMTMKLVCSHYYHTAFNADVLIEAAKQSDWNPSELYNRLVQALGDQRASLSSALNVAVNFLFQLWLEPIQTSQREYLTLGLLNGLTSGRSTREVLNLLADRIYRRFALHPLAEQDILSLIRAYAQTHSF